MICGGLIQLLWTKHAAFPEDDAIYIFVTKEIWKKIHIEKKIYKINTKIHCTAMFSLFILYIFLQFVT